jgi:hypothetical protein
MRHIFVTLSVLALMLVGFTSEAQVRSSASYSIERDSINTGGGLSNSSSFGLESTVGEVGTGNSESANYEMFAGYQQVDNSFLSLTPAADVTMSPALGGVTGGVSNGSTFVVATTDAPAGYQLFVSAESSPALQFGAEMIDDYTPAGAVPDFSFSTDSGEAHFGMSIESVDAADDFTEAAGVCGSGGNTPGSCWDGLSVSERLIADGGSNYPTGATTTLNFRVGVGDGAMVVPGTYTSTTTVTLIAL